MKKYLTIAREIGDRGKAAQVVGNLGIAYLKLGDIGKTVQFHEQVC